MARPTEPGWYWLNNRDGHWEIVRVDMWRSRPNDLIVLCTDVEGGLAVGEYLDSQWGGRITQEPAPDPPPPF